MSRSRGRRAVRRPGSARRAAVLVLVPVTLLQCALVLVTGILYPAYLQPDEMAHVDYVLAHRDGEWFDGPGERLYQSGVLVTAAIAPPWKPLVAGEQPRVVPRDDRPSIDAAGTAPDTSRFPEQMVQHPPGYYGLAAGFSFLVPDFSQLRFDVQVFWLRLLSLLLLAPVPLLSWLIGRRLTGSSVVGVAAAILPLAVPSYLRSGASVTNDALMIPLGALFVLGLARVLTGDHRWRTAVLLGVVWGALLLTKGFALALPVPIVAAYAVGCARGRVRTALRGLVTVGVVGSVVGAWWWVRNLVEYGVVQTKGLGPTHPESSLYGPAKAGISTWDYLGALVPKLLERPFGSLGLVDVPFPPAPLLVALTGASLALTLAGVVVGCRRAVRAHLAAVVLVLPLVAVLAVIVFGTYSLYRTYGVLPGVQVRYFVPFLPGLSVVGAIALTALAGRWRRLVPALVLIGALAYVATTQLYLLAAVGSSRGDGPAAWDQALRYLVRWAPFPDPVSVSILAAVPLTVVLGLVATLVLRGRLLVPADAPGSALAGSPPPR